VGPRFSVSEEKELARFARRSVVELLTLLESEVPGERQAAVFVLGLSGDGRAVAPLFGVLIRQRHWYDRDYATRALGQLGKVALPFLEQRALSKKPAEAELALLAIAESRADTLVALRRIGKKRRRLPAGFHRAFTDPRGLPDLFDALGNRATRDEALAAAEEILCRSGYGRLPIAKRRAFARSLEPLAGDIDVNVRAQALVCLGRLRVPDSLRIVREALADPEDDVVAAATSALAHLGSEEAKREIVALLGQRAIRHRALAAGALLEGGLARGEVKPRALAALVDAATGPKSGWLRERAVLTMARHRAASEALVTAAESLRGVRRRRAANALVELARLSKHPAATHARTRKRLRGEALRALDEAWRASEQSEARIEADLARLRESRFPRSRP
jgi:HEAT repeat protein